MALQPPVSKIRYNAAIYRVPRMVNARLGARRTGLSETKMFLIIKKP
jgi:hypothetical protein